MAGAMRKMALYLGLVEDDQFDDDYYETDDRDRDRRDRDTSASRSRGSERNDSIRVTERDSDYETQAIPRRQSASARASRDWRSDTMVQERPTDSGGHPAGTRAKAANRASAGSEGYKITTLQPRSYADARRIGEDFRNQTPVIMNLTELDDVDAKRIVDFAAGLVFGLRGSIERVSNKVFLLSPANVDVSAAARAQLAQDGFFSQQ